MFAQYFKKIWQKQRLLQQCEYSLSSFKPLKRWSGEQDRCSFHPGSRSYRDGHMNNSPFMNNCAAYLSFEDNPFTLGGQYFRRKVSSTSLTNRYTLVRKLFPFPVLVPEKNKPPSFHPPRFRKNWLPTDFITVFT